MVLAGLRRCEVLGLRMADVRVGDRRLFVAEGKGGHQRMVPVTGRILRVLGDYLRASVRSQRRRTGCSWC
jgi:integrase/recombinase XerD